MNFNEKKKIQDYGMAKIHDYTDHLVDFFEFYRDFDFRSNVICVYLGQAIPVNSYPNVTELEMYKDNFGPTKRFNVQPVNVADLLNLNYNMAHGVGKKRLKKFEAFTAEAVELLQENMSSIEWNHTWWIHWVFWSCFAFLSLFQLLNQEEIKSMTKPCACSHFFQTESDMLSDFSENFLDRNIFEWLKNKR